MCAFIAHPRTHTWPTNLLPSIPSNAVCSTAFSRRLGSVHDSSQPREGRRTERSKNKIGTAITCPFHFPFFLLVLFRSDWRRTTPSEWLANTECSTSVPMGHSGISLPLTTVFVRTYAVCTCRYRYIATSGWFVGLRIVTTFPSYFVVVCSNFGLVSVWLAWLSTRSGFLTLVLVYWCELQRKEKSSFSLNYFLEVRGG